MTGAARFRFASRAARIVALLCFLLPFATVSCSSRALNDTFNNAIGPITLELPVTRAAPAHCIVLQASGLQLALGTAEPRTDCVGAAAAWLRAGGTQSLAGTPLAQTDFAVIGAAALIVLALLLSLVLRGATAVYSGLFASLLTIIALSWSIFIRLPEALRAVPLPRPVPVSPAQIGRIFEVNGAAGFWLLVLALALASLFDVLALDRSRAAATAAGDPP